MNILVVYFSKFGHTRALAEEIGAALADHASVQVQASDQLSESSFNGVDLVVMGCPTHNMNLPKVVQTQLAGLPERALRGVRYAAFDTSYKMSWLLNHFTAAKRLDGKLRQRGGRRIAKPVTFHVEGREGPLFPGELARARVWARGLAAGQSAGKPAVHGHLIR